VVDPFHTMSLGNRCLDVLPTDVVDAPGIHQIEDLRK
jgi:hypothetical protein